MTVKLVAAVPPKLTAVAPWKLLPVIITTVPLPPEAGVNEVIVGAFLRILATKASDVG